MVSSEHNVLRQRFSKQAGMAALLAGVAMFLLSGESKAKNLTIEERKSLKFGTVAACGAAAGSVKVDTNGFRTTGGCAMAVGGTIQAGEWRLDGDPPDPTVVSVATPSVTLSNGAGSTMVVNSFNLVTNNGGPTGTMTPRETFNVGATLNLKPAQAAGTYIGSFSIIANTI